MGTGRLLKHFLPPEPFEAPRRWRSIAQDMDFQPSRRALSCGGEKPIGRPFQRGFHGAWIQECQLHLYRSLRNAEANGHRLNLPFICIFQDSAAGSRLLRLLGLHLPICPILPHYAILTRLLGLKNRSKRPNLSEMLQF